MFDVQREKENVLRKLYETIDRYYPDDIKVDFTKYLETSGIINLLNQQGGLTFLIDVKHLRIIHMSGSVLSFTGYKIEEFDDDILSKFIDILTPEHRLFLNVFVTWALKKFKTFPIEYKAKQSMSVWGLQLFHKSQRNMKCHLNIIPLEFNDDKNPTLIAISIHEVTHLIKGDDYLIRAEFTEKENSKKIFVYYSNENKTVENDVISEREREVLQHISQGLDTKQIAEKLHITKNTVDNHRRNMLARTGTRDTTALVQLCRMTAII